MVGVFIIWGALKFHASLIKGFGCGQNLFPDHFEWFIYLLDARLEYASVCVCVFFVLFFNLPIWQGAC